MQLHISFRSAVYLHHIAARIYKYLGELPTHDAWTIHTASAWLSDSSCALLRVPSPSGRRSSYPAISTRPTRSTDHSPTSSSSHNCTSSHSSHNCTSSHVLLRSIFKMAAPPAAMPPFQPPLGPQPAGPLYSANQVYEHKTLPRRCIMDTDVHLVGPSV